MMESSSPRMSFEAEESMIHLWDRCARDAPVGLYDERLSDFRLARNHTVNSQRWQISTGRSVEGARRKGRHLHSTLSVQVAGIPLASTRYIMVTCTSNTQHAVIRNPI
jgi:hypothetical protein